MKVTDRFRNINLEELRSRVNTDGFGNVCAYYPMYVDIAAEFLEKELGNRRFKVLRMSAF